jgi:hypothetical protein
LETNGLLREIGDIRGLGVDTVLQGEILVRLVARSWTGSELAAKIFGVDNGVTMRRAEYMKVVRALAALERRGYVAKALFGKERPYRLTDYGKEMVMAALKGTSPTVLFPQKELAWHVAAAGMTASTLVLIWMRTAPEILMACWLGTGLLVGLSLARFWRTLRRVL